MTQVFTSVEGGFSPQVGGTGACCALWGQAIAQISWEGLPG